MQTIKPEHTAIAAIVVVGAFIAGGAISPIKPSRATDCDSGWISNVIKDAQNALGQDDHGISEGERNQIAEIYRARGQAINPDDIRVSKPKAATTQSFNPAIVPPAVAEPVMQPPAVAEPAIVPPAVAEPVMQPPAVAEPVMQPPAVAEPVMQPPAVAAPAVAASAPSFALDANGCYTSPIDHQTYCGNGAQ